MIQTEIALQSMRKRRPFIYQAAVAYGAGAGVGTQIATSIRVTDLDYVCSSIRIVTRANATGIAIDTDDNDGAGELGGHPDVPFLVSITETGSNRQLQDNAFDGLALFDPRGDLELPVPLLITASTQLTFTLSNLKAFVAATTARIILVGFHLYP